MKKSNLMLVISAVMAIIAIAISINLLSSCSKQEEVYVPAVITTEEIEIEIALSANDDPGMFKFKMRYPEEETTVIETEEESIVVETETEIMTAVETSVVIEETTTIETQQLETSKLANTIHVVKTNDNFYRISTKYYGSGKYTQALQAFNETKMIRPGDELIIPNENDSEFINLYNDLVKEEIKRANEYNESMAGTTIKAGPSTNVTYGNRTNPAVDITIPTGKDMKNYTGEVDTSSYEYVGKFKITGYTPTCVHCCHNAEGITASGVRAIYGYTVACKEFEFGTTLYFEGYGYYVVEDRGPQGGIMDIASPDHESCGPITKNNVNVYVVSNP